MASFGAATFEEASSSRITRSASTSDPNIRLRASGGEIITAAQTPRTARIAAYCTTAELAALRLALIAGELQTLTLDDETLSDAFLSEISDPTDIFGRGTWAVSLSFEVATRVDTPHLLVWVGGDILNDVISLDTDTGEMASARITVANQHPGQRGDAVEIYCGIDDDILSVFVGVIEQTAEEFYPGEWTIGCVGRGKYLDRQLDADINYTGFTSHEMVDDLLDRRFITARDVPSGGFTLGTKAKVVARKGDTYRSWIDRVAEIDRMRLWEDHTGTVRYSRDDPFAFGTSGATLTVGENVLEGITHTEDVDAIRNHARITGLSHNGADVTGTAFVSSGELNQMLPGTDIKNTKTINSSLIETNAQASDVADLVVADLAPLQHRIVIPTPLNPELVPGMTVTVHAEPFGFTGLLAEVRRVKHQIDGSGGTTRIEINTGNFNAL
jgi:hypothetical protein